MRFVIRWLKNVGKRIRRSAGAFLCVTAVFFVVLHLRSDNAVYTSYPTRCPAIDVVYTWVNGSDPAFIESLQRYDLHDYDPARFDDKNELRYSLRSLEKYAPWLRHIYIVTNGQIPYWLDLSNERITVVPHDLLVPRPELLPTFSSAAIETFLHNIPRLSQRFLYLNDDIFIGSPLYPEDLYSEAEGVRIYQAWMVPDCAVDCPWTYIGDGACDLHCNIDECQYDGGDCTSTMKTLVPKVDKEEEANVEVAQSILAKKKTKYKHETSRSYSEESKKFPSQRKYSKQTLRTLRNASTFKNLMRRKNLTTMQELRRIVDNFNSVVKSEPAKPYSSTLTVRISKAYKSTKDIYSQSLVHTNKLLNRFYGFKTRNVLAHVGFLLERDIIDAMHYKFAREVQVTAENRFRSANDLQFSFAYYSYIMSETRSVSVEEIFDEFDTDASQTWSDREIRTLLTRMYPLPLDWSAIKFFDEVVHNCSQNLGHESKISVAYSTLVYERYQESNVPTITRELVAACPLLAEALVANFGVRSKYIYNTNTKRSSNNYGNFMMLTSNVSEVVEALDKFRRNPKKFNCINDNLELQPHLSEDNILVRQLLEDFYLSFFPKRSKFELQPQFRNRFTKWQDYMCWRRRKRAALVIAYGASLLLILFLVHFLCIHKAKLVRRCMQKL